MKPRTHSAGQGRRSLMVALVLVVAGALAGCATQPLPGYQVSIANQNSLARLPLGVKYQVSYGKDVAVGTTGVRGLTSSPPKGSWSAFLADGLQQELVSAGHFGGNTGNIEVTVTKIMLGDGQAKLSGHFVVTRDGAVIYDKVLAVSSSWESSFMGVIAASNGVGQFGAIFQKLLKKFSDDADFIKLDQK